MRIKIKFTVLLSIFIIFCFSCQSQESSRKEEIEKIINVALAEYDSVYLIKETYYNDNSLKPVNVLYPYYRVYNYKVMDEDSATKANNVAFLVFLKDVDGLISKSELDEMKERYGSWTLKEWKAEDIHSKKVELISIDKAKTKFSIPIIHRSEPLFTADGKKAIIFGTYVKNGVGGSGITILIKENGKWKIKGAIPNGTIG